MEERGTAAPGTAGSHRQGERGPGQPAAPASGGAGARGLDPDLIAAAAALGVLGLLLFTAAPRLAHPFDLEWMEGGMLVHAERVRRGLPLYVAPSAEFVPFIYPPLTHWLLGLWGKVAGVDYLWGRLLSLAGSLAAAGAAVAALRQEGARWGLALAAGGLFLSTYEDVGTFFDLVRTDGLFIGLLSWALVRARAGGPVSAGLLLAAAFMAKHNGAAFGLPMLVWLWMERGRAEALRFAAASVLPALLFLGLMQAEGDGLFLTYLLAVPAAHPIVGDRVFPGTFLELLGALPLCGALLIAALALRLRAGGWARPADLRPWGAALLGVGALAVGIGLSTAGIATPLGAALPVVAGGGVGLAGLALLGLLNLTRAGAPRAPAPGDRYLLWAGALAVALSALMRGHHGGFLNVLMPGMWALAVGGALALHRLRAGGGPRWAPLVGALALAGQLGADLWDPAEKAPRPGDRAAGEALVARIAAEPGPVWAPASPWLAVQAGKEPGTHLIALWDVNHKGGALASGIKPVKEALAAHRWALIIGHEQRPDQDLGGWGLQAHYRKAEDLTPPGQALTPRVGWRARPRRAWRPKAEATPGE